LTQINATACYQADAFDTVESAFMGADCFTTARRRNQANILPENVSQPERRTPSPVPSRLSALTFDGVSPQLRRHFFTRQAFEK
jgi:hypothetical protein